MLLPMTTDQTQGLNHWRLKVLNFMHSLVKVELLRVARDFSFGTDHHVLQHKLEELLRSLSSSKLKFARLSQ